jgi:alkaline phosphatase D
MATGFKTGEVTDTSAIVWTRLTARPERNPADGPMFRVVRARESVGENAPRPNAVTSVEFPDGVGVADLRDAAPGAEGQVRVRYRPQGAGGNWNETQWAAVDPNADYTRQFPLTGLAPGTLYDVVVESRAADGRSAGTSLEGTFRTAPAAATPAKVVFVVSTCQMFDDKDRPDGFAIYETMRGLNPDFFVHAGDIVYYDQLAKTAALARYHWQRTYSLPTNVDFHRHVSSYFMKDDHDTWTNEAWPGMPSRQMHEFTFEQGQRIFREQVPMGERTYRTVRWGKDLQIWLVEGRDYRSPNNLPDGPEKTIWGAEQKAWFKRTVEESDAAFRVLISPTPIVGPDRDNKHDNHSNRDFAHEGNELRDFLAAQENMVVICGDRHWQYLSVDPETGVREYSCGPASDQHAGGWQQDDFRPEKHKFLRVAGGFLAVTIEREQDKPQMVLRFHGIDGQVHFEDTRSH